MAETETVLNPKILSGIRDTIKAAMANHGYTVENKHYNLSQIREDTATFKMELLAQDLNAAKIKSIFKYEFHHRPKVDIKGSFIKLDFSQQYEHLASSN